MPRRLALALLAILATLALTPTLAQSRSLYFGISANSRSGPVPGDVQDVAAETGVNRLREDLEWRVVEPADDAWNWTKPDQMYEEAAERGLNILPITNASPCWAVPSLTDPHECEKALPTSPASVSDYAEFVGRVAARYGPGGDFWDAHPELDGNLASRHIEIWNEPYWGDGFWSGNYVAYGAMYKEAVAAGRMANPATRYLIESNPAGSGGVAWAESLLAVYPTLGTYIDGIAVHPYPGPHDISYQPTSGTDEAFLNARISYERWKFLGVNKPIWITEVGYSSCNDIEHCVPGSSQATRENNKAEMLKPLLAELGADSYAYVHAVYLYNLRQSIPASQPDNKKSNWYGISYGGAFEHLPVWTTFTDAVEAFDGTPEPNTTIASQTIAGESASFSFSANDLTASLECKLDVGAWGACTSPKAYNPTGGGSHTFQVRANNAESVEGLPASYSWVTAPSATTETATGVNGTEATLNASVNPKGTATSYRFEYWTSPASPSSIPVPDKSIGSGTANVKVSEIPTGLKPDTSYSYRIVATNTAGIVTKGAEQVFKTAKTIASSLGKLPVVEPFDGSTGSGSGPWMPVFWQVMPGASGAGQDTISGWGPFNGYPAVNGAYRSTIPYLYNDAGFGGGAAVTMAVAPGASGHAFSIWFVAKNAFSWANGYELRFTLESGSEYNVALYRVTSSTGFPPVKVQTTLATGKWTISPGSSVALVDAGSVVSAWVDSGAGFTQVFSAVDTSYNQGYVGLSGSGTATRLVNLKAGAL
ncbi:MAG TPA: hypothetical protein VFX45_12315 [Solirubrobacterales bacterium]|nr:hypothetical protein [Solirubrobacterales bacterium]